MDKADIERLHSDLLTAWNKQDATKMASLYLFQNTPAQFHGRPDMVEECIKELTAMR